MTHSLDFREREPQRRLGGVTGGRSQTGLGSHRMLSTWGFDAGVFSFGNYSEHIGNYSEHGKRGGVPAQGQHDQAEEADELRTAVPTLLGRRARPCAGHPRLFLRRWKTCPRVKSPAAWI